MSDKRIMLIESGQFIGGVISNLFQQHERLDIIETAPASTGELLEALQIHDPHIVVLDDTVNGDFLSVLLNCLQDCDHMRVVVVNTNNNNVSLYQKQQILVRRTEDFFSIL